MLGVLSLFIGNLLDAAWAITLGVGNLCVGYGQRHPDQLRGLWAWVLGILWGVIFAALTIARLTTR